MKTLLCVMSAMILIIGSAYAQEKTDSGIRVLVPEVNLFANDNIKSGDEFMGLHATSRGYILIPRKISVDLGVDERGRKTMRVIANSENQPLFLVQGLNKQSAGPIATIFSGRKFLFPGESMVLAPEGEPGGTIKYTLRAFGKSVAKDSLNLIYDYAVKAYADKDSQVLDFYRAGRTQSAKSPQTGVLNVTDHLVKYDLTRNMEVPTLIWSGDVDRDDKPDFFMWWPCPGRNAGVYSLFLSSIAPKGDIVKKVPVVAYSYQKERDYALR